MRKLNEVLKEITLKFTMLVNKQKPLFYQIFTFDLYIILFIVFLGVPICCGCWQPF